MFKLFLIRINPKQVSFIIDLKELSVSAVVLFSGN